MVTRSRWWPNLWLFTSALNKIRDRHRYQHRQRRSPDREAEPGEHAHHAYATLLSPSRELIDREQLRRLDEAFHRLPEQYQEVITLARIVGMPHAEIAAHLGRSPGAVRTMLGRALARLAELCE